MLIEFSVANYRSFRDEVTFSMVASPLKSEGAESDVRNQFAAPGDIRLLTSAAIYGANASGKSNFISAIKFMRHFVINSSNDTVETGGIDVEPFRLSTETETKPSFFEIVFIAGKRHYRYGFEVTGEQVEAEWLYVTPKVRELMLFERTLSKVDLGGKLKTEGRDLAERTRPNALFLTVAAQFNSKVAQQVLDWFRSLELRIGMFPNSEVMRFYTVTQFANEESAAGIKEFVRRLDLGIEDILIEKEYLENLFKLPPLPEDAPEQLPELYSALESVRDALAEFDEFSEPLPSTVRTVHRKVDVEGRPVTLELFDLDSHESEGTKKLFALSGPLVDTLKHGKVFIIDELDARLHPLLTQQIIKLFNDAEENSQCAQLVFTTQDTNLLDHQLFRRDQIWFTEKDHLGSSYLYSLVEFKIDDDAPFESDYIRGRYGAIPYLSGVRQVISGEE